MSAIVVGQAPILLRARLTLRPTGGEKYVQPTSRLRYLVSQIRRGESESESMTMQQRIVARLTEGLAPEALDILDESARHAGHAGVRTGPGHAKGAGETHYRVRIVSQKFAGLGRVARHRLVYDLLPAEFADGLHALAVDAKAPGEP